MIIFFEWNLENSEIIAKKITEINPNSTIYAGEYIPINISEFNQQDNYVVFSGIVIITHLYQ